MAKRIPFGSNEIVVLDAVETILNQCSEGDVAITEWDGGYGVTFVGKNMELNSWEGAFETVEEAIQAVQDNA
jgi:hypothetical protein